LVKVDIYANIWYKQLYAKLVANVCLLKILDVAK